MKVSGNGQDVIVVTVKKQGGGYVGTAEGYGFVAVGRLSSSTRELAAAKAVLDLANEILRKAFRQRIDHVIDGESDEG